MHDKGISSNSWRSRLAEMPAPSEPKPMEPAETVRGGLQNDDDPFGPRSEYKAIRTIRGERSMDAFFEMDGGEWSPGLPWLHLTTWSLSPDNTAISLFWPGIRIEVRGENLRTIASEIMVRRAAVWCLHDGEQSVRDGEPVIRSIASFVLDEENGTAAAGKAALKLYK